MSSVSQQEGDLPTTTFQTYLYLVKVGKPVGPRDVMRGANLTSPSVAYRNLQRLIDTGLVAKDEYGNYLIKRKVNINGYVWVGKKFIPRFILFGFVFIGVLIFEIAVIVPHLIRNARIEESLWLMTGLTIVTASIFLFEGIRWKRKNQTAID